MKIITFYYFYLKKKLDMIKSAYNFFFQASLNLLSLIDALLDYILKIIKLLYDIPKVCNHWFAIYFSYIEIILKNKVRKDIRFCKKKFYYIGITK